MANFQASFLNGSGNVAITLNSGQLVILDESNYDTNTDGINTFNPATGSHTQADFSLYRVLSITDPNNNVTTYSTLYPTDGSSALTVAAVGQTLPLQNNFTVTQDGLYTIILYTVPTWDAEYVALSVANGGFGYYYNAANPVCVFYNGNLYQLIGAPQTGGSIATTSTPGTDNTWLLITQSQLPTKYVATQNIILTYTLNNCYQQVLINLTGSYGCNPCNSSMDICKSTVFQQASELFFIIQSLPILFNQGLNNACTNLLNLTANICNCCYTATGTYGSGSSILYQNYTTPVTPQPQPNCNVPNQPSAIIPSTSNGNFLCTVTPVAGVTYNWTVTGGISLNYYNSGQGTNQITCNIVPGVSGTITVTPSNSCGNGESQSLTYTLPS